MKNLTFILLILLVPLTVSAADRTCRFAANGGMKPAERRELAQELREKNLGFPDQRIAAEHLIATLSANYSEQSRISLLLHIFENRVARQLIDFTGKPETFAVRLVEQMELRILPPLAPVVQKLATLLEANPEHVPTIALPVSEHQNLAASFELLKAKGATITENTPRSEKAKHAEKLAQLICPTSEERKYIAHRMFEGEFSATSNLTYEGSNAIFFNNILQHPKTTPQAIARLMAVLEPFVTEPLQRAQKIDELRAAFKDPTKNRKQIYALIAFLTAPYTEHSRIQLVTQAGDSLRNQTQFTGSNFNFAFDLMRTMETKGALRPEYPEFANNLLQILAENPHQVGTKLVSVTGEDKIQKGLRHLQDAVEDKATLTYQTWCRALEPFRNLTLSERQNLLYFAANGDHTLASHVRLEGSSVNFFHEIFTFLEPRGQLRAGAPLLTGLVRELKDLAF